MTVSELIEDLQKYPPHHPVLVDQNISIKSIESGSFSGPCVSFVCGVFDGDEREEF